MERDDVETSLVALAARLILEEGLAYGQAKRKAARTLRLTRGLPSNEAIEDEVRAQIDLFHAHTQPQELLALRELALVWMNKLERHRPHLADAVWRGTATRWSSVRLELYADDEKSAQIDLLNLGVSDALGGGREEDGLTMAKQVVCNALNDTVWVEVLVMDADALRGALKPDARGRTWRGDTRALSHLLASQRQSAA
jgi:hypothetical protein